MSRQVVLCCICCLLQFSVVMFQLRLKANACVDNQARISWDYWFKKVLYYQVALVYVLTRLVVNVSQVSLLPPFGFQMLSA